ncbi:hypothetical protein ACFOEE_15055 [Pseudoalteromonas fenneropenaei]|uniref:Uncharacterized protein n=1 Tax=Pseudoalteromonas fenneropenaei TaxID=1737459 RepID=A0ABV7CMD5_9GAMM
MANFDEKLDTQVLGELQRGLHPDLIAKLDALSCTHSDLVQLLVEYQVMSEQEDDEKFDTWYDGLCADKLTVLKAFEIFRTQLERRINE